MKRVVIVVSVALILVMALTGTAFAHVTGGGPSPTMTLNLSGSAAKWEGSTVECTAGEKVSLGGLLSQGTTKATGKRVQFCTGSLQAIEPLFVVKGGGPLVPGPATVCGQISTKAGGAIDQEIEFCFDVTLV
jgi:hypothetical protein